MAEVKLLSGQALATAIWELLNAKGALRCAVAFWGPEVAALAKRRSAKLVLDVAMKGTSQNALKALGVPDNPNVRVLDYLHTKLYIGEDNAILASANASRNALGSGSNPPLLHEAGILINRVREPRLYSDTVSLFDCYWEKSRAANPDDLERAPMASPLLAVRDQAPSENVCGSVLKAVLANPDAFERTAFVFTDEDAEERDKTAAEEAYAETLAPLDGAPEPSNNRQLICVKCDGKQDSALSEVPYIIMYWVGSEEDIYAYHDIVRVKARDGSISFFGHRQWSTVRNRIGLAGQFTVSNVLKADRTRAQDFVELHHKKRGDRFLVFKYDELYEKLEARD